MRNEPSRQFGEALFEFPDNRQVGPPPCRPASDQRPISIAQDVDTQADAMSRKDGFQFLVTGEQVGASLLIRVLA